MRKQLPTAPDGFVYTDGKETHGVDIDLGEGRTEAEFHLITREEYEEIKKAKEEVIE